ncbi:hypothetical protein KAI65_00385 [Candidatus Parcubacteria bacterium]|nr:hypothetical protein [Candidatus Parcubacteria bacterium]
MPNTKNFDDISSRLRQSKINSDIGLAEKGANMAIKSLAPGIGTAALKFGKATGIPVTKIILFAVVSLLLFLGLIILAGGYAVTHKWEVLKFIWLN